MRLFLASHWPCGTDFSGLSTYGLNGQRKGDEHPTYAPVGVWYTLLCFAFALLRWVTVCVRVNHLGM